jgi:glycolate oxidase FAD binding subunit
LGGEQLIEWGGHCAGWSRGREPMRARCARGLAATAVTRRSSGQRTKRRARFHPLPDALHQLHRRLKATFDPAGILNRGRLYPDF